MNKGFRKEQRIKYKHKENWNDGVFVCYSAASKDMAHIKTKSGLKFLFSLENIKEDSELEEDNPNIAFKAAKSLRTGHIKKVRQIKVTEYMVEKLQARTGISKARCRNALQHKNGSLAAAMAYMNVSDRG